MIPGMLRIIEASADPLGNMGFDAPGETYGPSETIDHYPTITDVRFVEISLLLRWYLYLRQPACQNEEYIFEAIINRLIDEDSNFVVRQHPNDVPVV